MNLPFVLDYKIYSKIMIQARSLKCHKRGCRCLCLQLSTSIHLYPFETSAFSIACSTPIVAQMAFHFNISHCITSAESIFRLVSGNSFFSSKLLLCFLLPSILSTHIKTVHAATQAITCRECSSSQTKAKILRDRIIHKSSDFSIRRAHGALHSIHLVFRFAVLLACTQHTSFVLLVHSFRFQFQFSLYAFQSVYILVLMRSIDFWHGHDTLKILDNFTLAIAMLRPKILHRNQRWLVVWLACGVLFILIEKLFLSFFANGYSQSTTETLMALLDYSLLLTFSFIFLLNCFRIRSLNNETLKKLSPIDITLQLHRNIKEIFCSTSKNSVRSAIWRQENEPGSQHKMVIIYFDSSISYALPFFLGFALFVWLVLSDHFVRWWKKKHRELDGNSCTAI